MGKLRFNDSQPLTLGVEIELQVIDKDKFDLIPEAHKLLALCQKKKIDRVKAEIHQSMIEVDSEVSQTVGQCHNFLKERLQHLCLLADSIGVGIGITATHPFQRWEERLITNEERYHEIHRKYRWLARRFNVYGLHVHIGMPSGEKALYISRALNRYIPHLIALSANSPFWQSVDTGMQSSRVNIIDGFPFAGLSPDFQNWDEFEYYYYTLKKADVINSHKDLYWYVRPSLDFGTLEIRICDSLLTLSETMSIVALIQCLVYWLDEDPDRVQWSKEHYWIAPENHWIAARDGLNGKIITKPGDPRVIIRQEIEELINTLRLTAEHLGCKNELLSVLDILQTGNGADRQRAIHLKTGSLEEVVNQTQRYFRKDLGLE